MGTEISTQGEQHVFLRLHPSHAVVSPIEWGRVIGCLTKIAAADEPTLSQGGHQQGAWVTLTRYTPVAQGGGGRHEN
jgi:hypothetical protein